MLVLGLGLLVVRQQFEEQFLGPEECLAFDDKRYIVGTSVEELDPGCLLLWFDAMPGSPDAFVEGFDVFAALPGGEEINFGG